MTGSDPIAAISEQAARGETAELYEDIRATLGVPVVNLVWRHLASIEGALAWAWQAVRPAYAEGRVATQAPALKTELELPALPAIPPEVLRGLGLSAQDSGLIRGVVASYDRSNSMNWLALGALLVAPNAGAGAGAGALEGAGGATASRPSAASSTAVPLRLPPLPAFDQMTPDTRALVLRLDSLGQSRADAIPVSMYRHLAHWPGFLSLLWAMLAPLANDQRLQAATSRVEHAARRHSAYLREALPAPGEHAPGRAALADFLTRIGLPRMIAIAAMLERALPPMGATPG